MGIFSLFKRTSSTRAGHTTLTDEDRAAGLEIRQINSQIKKARREAELEKAKLELFKVQQEVQEIRDSYADDYDDDEAPQTPNDMLMMMFMQMMNRQQQAPSYSSTTHPNQPSAPITAHTAQGRELSHAEMAQLLKDVPPAVRRRLKKLDDSQLEAQIYAVVPDISPNSLEMAKQFIRES